ncbi:MAG: hypothetical protein FXF47_07320 [Candidatus Mcinerneyibacterium aminivorans]|uniref:Uncharacterized protein n=1 Tax=Candidatus Mcinerneyibacterium aminivorans TaxID=2703815 RepID=A0A5D0MGT7_9BACT|nr:MAG: hypothetical protein FXF47_07320 [Candidatus Mcinerneyibacterium aminivorans]
MKKTFLILITLFLIFNYIFSGDLYNGGMGDEYYDQKRRGAFLTESTLRGRMVKKFYNLEGVIAQTNGLLGTNYELAVGQPINEEQQAIYGRAIYKAALEKLNQNEQDSIALYDKTAPEALELAAKNDGDNTLDIKCIYDKIKKEERLGADEFCLFLGDYYNSSVPLDYDFYQETEKGEWEKIDKTLDNVRGQGKVRLDVYMSNGELFAEPFILEPFKKSALEKSIEKVGNKYVAKYKVGETKDGKDIYLKNTGHTKEAVLSEMTKFEEDLSKYSSKMIRMIAGQDENKTDIKSSELDMIYK